MRSHQPPAASSSGFAPTRAATAIEYATVTSGVGVAISAAVYTLGGKVKDLFTNVSGLFG